MRGLLASAYRRVELLMSRSANGRDRLAVARTGFARAGQLCVVAAALLLGAECRVVVAGDEITPVVDALIRQLSSDEFESRVLAQRELGRLAESAPEILAARIPGADAEAQARLIGLLEGVFLKHDDAVGLAAERALYQLSHSDQSGAQRAASVLRSAARLRQSRAQIALEKLGAVFAFIHPAFLTDNQQALLAPGQGVGFGPDVALSAILLPHDWQGTRDDLWHLQRFEHCANLTLFDCVFNNVSQLEILQAVSEIPGIVVEQRGGFLGLKGSEPIVSGRGGVTGVPVPGGAAAAAGILADDLIRELNGAPLASFSQLVESLKVHRPGETIILTVERKGEMIDLPVTLMSWRNHISDRRHPVAPPPPFAGPLGADGPPSPALPVPLSPTLPEMFILR